MSALFVALRDLSQGWEGVLEGAAISVLDEGLINNFVTSQMFDCRIAVLCGK